MNEYDYETGTKASNPHVIDNLKAIQKVLSNYDMSFLSDDEDDFCPLCLEPLDITDKNFKPCPCGYQICQFCYNNIRQNEELNGRCPACRRKYDDESVEYVILSPEDLKLEREKQVRKEWERKQREKERKENENANRKHLAGMRVIQKNLVYVVGINPPVPYEEVSTLLKSDKYFGQYGKINKIVINKKTPHSNSAGTSNDHYHHHSSGYGVYITFTKKEDAAKCITQVDGTYIDGRLVKAAYGTTKYCSSYLRGLPCQNPNCMFLHEPGEEADSFNRRELSGKQSQQQQSNQNLTGSTMGITNTATTHTNPLSVSATPSPAPIKTHLHHDTNHVPANPPLLTPAPLRTGSNPWGVTQSSTPISLNLSKNSSAANLPTLSDTLNHNSAHANNQQFNLNQSHGKKKHGNEKEHVDPYDALSSAVRFLNDKIQFLSNYENREIQLRPNLVDDETYKKYPALFTWENTESAEQSDNTLMKKLVDILAIKPLENTNSMLPILQNASVQLSQPITGTTSLPQTQTLHQSQPQQQFQPPLNVNAPLPPGMFVPQQMLMHNQQQQQHQQILPQQQKPNEDKPGANSTEFLNQLINGRRVTAAN